MSNPTGKTIRQLVEDIANQLTSGSSAPSSGVDLSPVLQRLDALGPMVQAAQSDLSQLKSDLAAVKTDLEGASGGGAPPAGATGAPVVAPAGPPPGGATGATAGGAALPAVPETVPPPGAGPSPEAAGVPIMGSPAATGGP